MVLNTQLEHAPVRVFQPKIGDVSHLLCTHLVESDATGLLTPIVSTPRWSSWVDWPDPVGLMCSLTVGTVSLEHFQRGLSFAITANSQFLKLQIGKEKKILSAFYL